MWAFTETGIMLHNTNNGAYIELKGPEERIWAYLDGSHTIDEVCRLVAVGQPDGLAGANSIVEKTIETLQTEGFISQ